MLGRGACKKTNQWTLSIILSVNHLTNVLVMIIRITGMPWSSHKIAMVA